MQYALQLVEHVAARARSQRLALDDRIDERRFRLEDAANQRDEVPKELARRRSSRHTLRDLEQCAPLFGRQPPMPARGMGDLRHLLLKSRVGEIFPPRLGIVVLESVHVTQIQACTRGSRQLLHITSC